MKLVKDSAVTVIMRTAKARTISSSPNTIAMISGKIIIAGIKLNNAASTLTRTNCLIKRFCFIVSRRYRQKSPVNSTSTVQSSSLPIIITRQRPHFM